jgi:serine/threonine protein kinase
MFQESWPGWEKLGDNVNMQWTPSENKLRSKFPTTFFSGSQPVLNEAGFDLLSQLLEMNPQKRISASECTASLVITLHEVHEVH